MVGGALALAAIGTVAIVVRPAITDGADPRELLATVQTSTDVHEISDHLASAQMDGTISSTSSTSATAARGRGPGICTSATT